MRRTGSASSLKLTTGSAWGSGLEMLAGSGQTGILKAVSLRKGADGWLNRRLTIRAVCLKPEKLFGRLGPGWPGIPRHLNRTGCCSRLTRMRSLV